MRSRAEIEAEIERLRAELEDEEGWHADELAATIDALDWVLGSGSDGVL